MNTKDSVIRHEIWDSPIYETEEDARINRNPKMIKKHVAIIKKDSDLDKLFRLITGSDILRDINVQFDHIKGTIIGLDAETH